MNDRDIIHEQYKTVLAEANQETMSEPSNGDPDQRFALPNQWRRLANSWLRATANIPRGDHVRDNALTRAQAYRDCAEDLTDQIHSGELSYNNSMKEEEIKKLLSENVAVICDWIKSDCKRIDVEKIAAAVSERIA